MLVDRYEFRLTKRELQYLDPISGDWRRLVRASDQDEVRETFETHWRDIRYSDEEKTRGTFMAFS